MFKFFLLFMNSEPVFELKHHFRIFQIRRVPETCPVRIEDASWFQSSKYRLQKEFWKQKQNCSF